MLNISITVNNLYNKWVYVFSILYSNGNFGIHLSQATGNFHQNLQEQVSLYSSLVDVAVTRDAVWSLVMLSSEIENQDQRHWAPLPEIYVMRLFLDN